MEAPIAVVSAARVSGGPRVVSISTEEDKAAVIASGIDELLVGARPTAGGGWYHLLSLLHTSSALFSHICIDVVLRDGFGRVTWCSRAKRSPI